MSKINKLDVLIEREGFIESIHNVFIYDNFNKTNDFIFPRSSVKPFQILPLLIEAKKQNIKFSNEEVAIFASSHSAEVIHTDLIAKLALKYNIDLNHLLCGPQRPFHEDTADSLLKQNKKFNQLHNNCSGKHLSMLIFAKLIDASFENYTSREHETQIRIEEYFKKIFNDSFLVYSVDGCGLPALKVNPQDFCLAVNKIQESADSDVWYQMFSAYNSFPELIGGTNRTDTNIIKHSFNDSLAKSGAEGVLFFTNNKDTFLFKCLDGNKRGVDLAATKFLYDKGFISSFPYEYIEKFYSTNTQDIKNIKINVI